MTNETSTCFNCGATIQGSPAHCSYCGAPVGGFARQEPHHLRIARQSQDRSHFVERVWLFSSLVLIGILAWIGIVPLVSNIKNPAALPVLGIIAAPLLMIAAVMLAFALPAHLKQGSGTRIAKLLAILSLAVAAWAFNAPYGMAMYLLIGAFVCGLLSLALGDRVLSATAIVMTAIGLYAVFLLEPVASDQLSIIDQWSLVGLEHSAPTKK